MKAIHDVVRRAAAVVRRWLTGRRCPVCRARIDGDIEMFCRRHGNVDDTQPGEGAPR